MSREKRAAIMAMGLVALLAAGCAPGDISRYARQAQLAGQALFEGGYTEAAAMQAEAAATAGGIEEETEEGTEEGAARTEDGGETDAARADGQRQGSIGESEAAGAQTASGADAETASGAETAAETEAEADAETEGAADAEAAAEAGGIAEEEGASGAEGAAGAEAAARAPGKAGAEQAAQPEVELPELMRSVPEETAEAVTALEPLFDGRLAGVDTLSEPEEKGLEAVLRKKAYDERTLALSYALEGADGETAAALLLVDADALEKRKWVRGDLWLVQGQTAACARENTLFEQVSLARCGESGYLLVETASEKGSQAQAYALQEGAWTACFEGAVAIAQEGAFLCVSYPSSHVRYDALLREWTGTDARIPCFYTQEEGALVLVKAREITEAEYRDLTAEGQEEGELGENRRSYFAIGDRWAGFRECVAGGTDGTDGLTAAWRYEIHPLAGGPEAEPYAGDGYYFLNWEEQEEELEALFEVPGELAPNRLSARAGLTQAQKRALGAVEDAAGPLEADLAFFYRADFDRDGEKESFVALGAYDGVFRASLCDLWYVKAGEAQPVAEAILMRDGAVYGSGGRRFCLLEGFSEAGGQSWLFGAADDGGAIRLLEGAQRISFSQNGDVTAWIERDGALLPDYYYGDGSSLAPYAVREVEPEALEEYENGAVVRGRLERVAALSGSRIAYLYRDNNLIHATLTGPEGKKSYETYLIRDGWLVLTEAGEGGYESGAAPEGSEEAGEDEAAEAAQGAKAAKGAETSKEAEAVKGAETAEEAEAANEAEAAKEAETAEGAERAGG